MINTIGIAADPRVVFDYVTDPAREHEWNPMLLSAIPLTAGPPGRGTSYRLRLRGTGWMTIEYTQYEPPWTWSSRGTSPRLTAESTGRVVPAGPGAELVVRTHLTPHGALRLASPVLRRVVSRHWDDNLRRIKDLLETDPAGSAAWPGDVRARPRRPWARARDTLVVLGEYAAEALYGIVRPTWRDPGATAQEVSDSMEGDDLVVGANWQATRAITIAADPSQVWPWLAQAGYGRGGWYGDLPWWKDPQGHTGPRSSASVLLPQHQRLAVGDVLLDGPNCDTTTGAWTVTDLEPGRTLVLFSRRTLSGREVRPSERRPASFFECSWAFVLRPLDAEACRLVVRSRARYHPAWMVRAAAVIRAGDTVMQRAMLMGIKRRAEGGPASQVVNPEGRRVDRVPVPDLCSLWAETPTTPMQLALASSIDGDPFLAPDGSVDVELIRGLVVEHLDGVPMLRRVLRRPPVGFGGPVWTDATSFRIEDHVALVVPERALVDEDAFWSWCAERSTVGLDRSRPLWRLDIVPALPDGRIGLLVVVHHVVADGLRGAAMLMALLDADPAPGRRTARVWLPEPPPSLTELALDRARVVRDGAHRGTVRSALRGARSIRLERGFRAPDTVLGGPIARGRQVKVLHVPVDTLRSLAHSWDCTINDLLLAAVAEGLHRFFSARGECPPDLVLRASAPVGAVSGRAPGMIVVPLPVGTADPAERLRQIAAETARRKQQPDEGIAGIVAMPRLLARLGVLWARRAAPAHINLYVTNVPGPPVPLHLHGAPLRTVVPMAPLVAGVRLSVTALSYAGTLAVTFLGDDNLGDLQLLADGAGEVLRTPPPNSGARQAATQRSDRQPRM